MGADGVMQSKRRWQCLCANALTYCEECRHCERTTMQMAKRVRAWHWVAESGKICLAVHYGAKTIELAKGMTAVELNSEADLLATLETIKQAVEVGELDTAIANVSGAVKSNFKK